MVERFESADKPDLESFPSAEAQDGIPVRVRTNKIGSKKGKFLKNLFRSLGVFVIVGLCIALAGLYVLSQRSVSNEQLRASLESQLSSLAGTGQTAKIGQAKIALGQGGLVAINATDVQIFNQGFVELGAAKDIAVKVKALPLLSGQIETKSVSLSGASIAVGNLLKSQDFYSQQAPTDNVWPSSINIEKVLWNIGAGIRQVAGSLKSSGLENVRLNETSLNGFSELGLRSQSGTLSYVDVSKQPGTDADLSIDAVLETEFGQWTAKGKWRDLDTGGSILTLGIDGLRIGDFLQSGYFPNLSMFENLPFTLQAEVPFLGDGTPQQGVLRLSIVEKAADASNRDQALPVKGDFNFRLLPRENQIEIERSTSQLFGHTATFFGGVRYPVSDDDPISNIPLFKFEIERFSAFGLVQNGEVPEGKLVVEGHMLPHQQAVDFSSIALTTPNGSINASAQMQFNGEKPSLAADVSIPSMPVDEFKQFWPAFLSPKVRNWAAENLEGGFVKDARVRMNFPDGLVDDGTHLTSENLSTFIPITKTSVRLGGQLPRLRNVGGSVKLQGNQTRIQIDRARLNIRGSKRIAIRNSSVHLTPGVDDSLNAKMDLKLSGTASSLARLVKLDPINVDNLGGFEANSLTGSGIAKVSANLIVGKKVVLGKKPWSAEITLNNVSSKKPVSGRSISGLNATVTANPSTAKISGDALIDGVPAKIALNQELKGKKRNQGAVTLKLDAKARKKFGIDTGDIVSGTVAVKLLTGKGAQNKIELDLKGAKLNLPWIGWSKGAGIPGRASLVLDSKKGAHRIKDLKLKGPGFSANGEMNFNKSGLLSAKFKSVKLNKTDDFDVSVSRKKNGYNINFNARSYDGRALIRSYLSGKASKSGGGGNISLNGSAKKLIGFNGQVLRNLTLQFDQAGKRISKTIIKAMAAGNSPTIFSLKPIKSGLRTEISTSNAGSLLQFLDLYSKVRGGTIKATLVQDNSDVFRGLVIAQHFTLIDEPRLAQLLKKPSIGQKVRGANEIKKRLKAITTERAKVKNLQARIIKGPGYLTIRKGRLSGGDASAAFDGQVYDKNNRMNVKGTFLPAKGLNRFVSKIPVLGLALGSGKVNGLLGITFKLSGRYGSPKLEVNPLSIIAPGVFRQLFKF